MPEPAMTATQQATQQATQIAREAGRCGRATWRDRDMVRDADQAYIAATVRSGGSPARPAGDQPPYITLGDLTFLREARAGRVYRSLGGGVMQRSRRPGVRSQRADRFYRKAVAAGWMTAEPGNDRTYLLTGTGLSALAARERSGGAR
jgi:hypothetical protein